MKKRIARIEACAGVLAAYLLGAPAPLLGQSIRIGAPAAGTAGSVGAAINSALHGLPPQMQTEVGNFLKSSDYTVLSLNQAMFNSDLERILKSPAAPAAPSAPSPAGAEEFARERMRDARILAAVAVPERVLNPQSEEDRLFAAEKLRGLVVALGPFFDKSRFLQLTQAAEQAQAGLSLESRRKLTEKMTAMADALLGDKSGEGGTASAESLNAPQGWRVDHGSFARRRSRLSRSVKATHQSESRRQAPIGDPEGSARGKFDSRPVKSGKSLLGLLDANPEARYAVRFVVRNGDDARSLAASHALAGREGSLADRAAVQPGVELLATRNEVLRIAADSRVTWVTVGDAERGYGTIPADGGPLKNISPAAGASMRSPGAPLQARRGTLKERLFLSARRIYPEGQMPVSNTAAHFIYGLRMAVADLLYAWSSDGLAESAEDGVTGMFGLGYAAGMALAGLAVGGASIWLLSTLSAGPALFAAAIAAAAGSTLAAFLFGGLVVGAVLAPTGLILGPAGRTVVRIIDRFAPPSAAADEAPKGLSYTSAWRGYDGPAQEPSSGAPDSLNRNFPQESVLSFGDEPQHLQFSAPDDAQSRRRAMAAAATVPDPLNRAFPQQIAPSAASARAVEAGFELRRLTPAIAGFEPAVDLPLERGVYRGRPSVTVYRVMSGAELADLEKGGALKPGAEGRKGFSLFWEGSVSDQYHRGAEKNWKNGEYGRVVRLHFSPELFDALTRSGRWAIVRAGESAGLLGYPGVPDGAVTFHKNLKVSRRIQGRPVFDEFNAEAPALDLLNANLLGFERWDPPLRAGG